MCESELAMIGRDASVCANSVMVPIYSTFCQQTVFPMCGDF